MTRAILDAAAGLPIAEALPALRAALAARPSAVLQAPPGAGKTTIVPLALLDEPWVAGRRILVLEPRRLAARAAAARMAALLGEEVGETVGYRIRLESRVGPLTRIEILTEGILTRRLQDDPGLDGVAAVLFDEFHERSLNADLGLALALDAQAGLRPDLRLLAMSATLDGAAVARLMGEAPVVASEGRAYPVDLRHLGEPAVGERLEAAVAAAVRRALAEETGGVLVFLPGEGEIRRAAARLEEGGLAPEIDLAPLYGALPRERQDAAIRPAPPGRRKLVLATAIAETSLTIDGIRVVVDAGLARKPRFDPASGMSRLVTLRVSRAAADQRAGRAGRLGPGVCYRLWSRGAEGGLAPFDRPEILEADLAPLALDLAAWGIADPAALSWLDPPPAPALSQARALLAELGALDGKGRITGHGRAMAELAMHPRLAHMVLAAGDEGEGPLACLLAALLEEGDVLRRDRPRDAGLRHRLDVLSGEGHEAGADRAAVRRALALAGEWRRRLRLSEAPGPRSPAAAGRLLARAYPDRLARRRPGGPLRYLLANGRGAALAEDDPLAGEPWLAVADLDGERQEARIRLAAPLDEREVERLFADRIREEEAIGWDSRAGRVVAERRRVLGAIVLAARPVELAPDDPRRAAGLCAAVREAGLAALPWSEAATALRHRAAFLARLEGEAGGWPDLGEAALAAGLEDWLAPHLAGAARLADLTRLDLAAILAGLLGPERRRRLDRLAPAHLALPSGRRAAIDYGGEAPVLAARLQELFGLTRHPTVADGRVRLRLHLLSPAGRPVQVTDDLAGFWASSYQAVRRELRGRYPKHAWPEDPATAAPPRPGRPRPS